ncbi:MAG TPA: SIR2 family protein [Ruminiclostridium sp.]|nr:SIR2 family protein [Ruminiclostridium sp.]
MEYAGGNEAAFACLCENIGDIVPFVGAGMSAFAYPCWSDFLKYSAKNLENEDKRRVSELINLFEYEDAAELIEKKHGPELFREDIKKAFGTYVITSKKASESIKNQAVWLLPDLFRTLVLTTNFDRILEHVYRLRGTAFKNVGHPRQSEILKEALMEESCPCLFKFHGDIESPERLVLTKKRYEECYRGGGSLVRELEAVFAKRSILFLGCSLSRDRTMAVIEKMFNRGVTHYAILGCNGNEIEKKQYEINEKGMKAILYPEKEYGAVKIILENLAENVNFQ